MRRLKADIRNNPACLAENNELIANGVVQKEKFPDSPIGFNRLTGGGNNGKWRTKII
jgi:hypothetical protein